MLMTSGQSVIGRKRTQFLYLQLLTSSVTTPQSAREPTTTCLGGALWPRADVQFPHLWFSTFTTADNALQ